MEKLNKKGVLFVINELRPGGAEMFLLRMAKYLSKEYTIFIHCLFPESNDEEFVSLFKDTLNFEFIFETNGLSKNKEFLYWKINAFFNLFGKKGVYTDLKNKEQRKCLERKIKESNIKIINTSAISSDYKSISYFKKYFKIPVVLTMHSDYNREFWEIEGRNRNDFFKLSSTILNTADYIFYTADHNIEILKQINIHHNNISKCYLGYEIEDATNIRKELEIEDDAFVVLMMARGIKEKGWIQAIEAFLKLNQINPKSYFLMIHTESEFMDQLKNEYRNDNIKFLGYVKNPKNHIYSSDCTMLPSHFPESLPYTITESLAYGKPVLTTAIAEIPQMLNANEEMAGEIIPFDNEGYCDSDLLSKKLIEYSTDLNVLNLKKSYAKIAFQKFSMNSCGENYKEVINKIIN